MSILLLRFSTLDKSTSAQRNQNDTNFKSGGTIIFRFCTPYKSLQSGNYCRCQMTMGRARIQKETKHSKDGGGFFSALDKVNLKFLQLWNFKLQMWTIYICHCLIAQMRKQYLSHTECHPVANSCRLFNARMNHFSVIVKVS